MDRILISDLEVEARIGVTEAERASSQVLLLTIELSLDLRRPATSDDVEDTIDYGRVVERVVQITGRAPIHLLEHLAGKIAADMGGLPQVQAVTVEVAKKSPPIAQRVGRVAVRLERGPGSD